MKQREEEKSYLIPIVVEQTAVASGPMTFIRACSRGALFSSGRKSRTTWPTWWWRNCCFAERRRDQDVSVYQLAGRVGDGGLAIYDTMQF